jgi:hypothetical protein
MSDSLDTTMGAGPENTQSNSFDFRALGKSLRKRWDMWSQKRQSDRQDTTNDGEASPSRWKQMYAASSALLGSAATTVRNSIEQRQLKKAEAFHLQSARNRYRIIVGYDKETREIRLNFVGKKGLSEGQAGRDVQALKALGLDPELIETSSASGEAKYRLKLSGQDAMKAIKIGLAGERIKSQKFPVSVSEEKLSVYTQAYQAYRAAKRATLSSLSKSFHKKAPETLEQAKKRPTKEVEHVSDLPDVAPAGAALSGSTVVMAGANVPSGVQEVRASEATEAPKATTMRMNCELWEDMRTGSYKWNASYSAKGLLKVAAKLPVGGDLNARKVEVLEALQEAGIEAKIAYKNEQPYVLMTGDDASRAIQYGITAKGFNDIVTGRLSKIWSAKVSPERVQELKAYQRSRIAAPSATL